LDRRWARYVSLSDLIRLVMSNAIGSLAGLLILAFTSAGVPRSVFAIDFLLCLCFTAGTRVMVRLIMESVQAPPPVRDLKRTVIYGAGSAGAALSRDLRHHPALKYEVCGFVDDNPQKRGLVLHDVAVLGTGDELAGIAKKNRIELVLIAVPSASGSGM